MDVLGALTNIGAAFGLSTSAGLNAYIPLLIVALAGRFPADNPFLNLSEPYNALSNWWVIGVLVVLLLIEMTVDKIPAIDTINDIVQTLVRPTAGAILFAANADVVTNISPALAVGAGLLLAGGVHVTKGVARPAVTATTAGTGNWMVSLIEDIIALFVSILALLLPILIGLVAALVFVLLLWFFWRRRQGRDKLVFR